MQMRFLLLILAVVALASAGKPAAQEPEPATATQCEQDVVLKCDQVCRAHCNNGLGNGPDCRPGRARFANDDPAETAVGNGGARQKILYATNEKGDNTVVSGIDVSVNQEVRTVCHDKCEATHRPKCKKEAKADVPAIAQECEARVQCRRTKKTTCARTCKVKCNNGLGNGPDCRPGRATFNNDDLVSATMGDGGAKRKIRYTTDIKGDNTTPADDAIVVAAVTNLSQCDDKCFDEVDRECKALPCDAKPEPEPKNEAEVVENIVKKVVEKKEEQKKVEEILAKEKKEAKVEEIKIKVQETEAKKGVVDQELIREKVAQEVKKVEAKEAAIAGTPPAPQCTARTKRKLKIRQQGAVCKDGKKLRKRVKELRSRVNCLLEALKPKPSKPVVVKEVTTVKRGKTPFKPGTKKAPSPKKKKADSPKKKAATPRNKRVVPPVKKAATPRNKRVVVPPVKMAATPRNKRVVVRRRRRRPANNRKVRRRVRRVRRPANARKVRVRRVRNGRKVRVRRARRARRGGRATRRTRRRRRGGRATRRRATRRRRTVRRRNNRPRPRPRNARV